MYTLIIILTVIVAILLIGVVLIQKSKGSGLSSTFAGQNQIMGVRRTNDFVEKATWTLASIICVIAIISAFVMPRDLIKNDIRTQQSTTPIPVQGANQYRTSFPETPAATPIGTPAPSHPE